MRNITKVKKINTKKGVVNGKPTYTAIAAITIDGKIAKHQHHFSNWTSPEDKTFLRRQLNLCDIIIVGRTTYETAKKPLSKRNCIVLTSKVKTVSVESPNLILFNPKTSNLKKFIANLKYQNIVVLGGAKTYQYCLEQKLLTDLYLTIEPISFGNGINLFSSAKPKTVKWQLNSIKPLNKSGSLLLHYSR